MNTFSPYQQRVVDQLRLFLGDEAERAYEGCGRSLLRLIQVARDSSLRNHRMLAAGLDLAQEALAEPMRSAPNLDATGFVLVYNDRSAADVWTSGIVDATHLKHNS